MFGGNQRQQLYRSEEKPGSGESKVFLIVIGLQQRTEGYFYCLITH